MPPGLGWEGWQGSLCVTGPGDFRVPCVWGRVFKGLGFVPLVQRAALVGSSLEDEWASWQIIAGISDFQAEVESRGQEV